MLKLSKIEKDGMWFVIPGNFFEKDGVSLKLSMITKKEQENTTVTERLLNRKSKRMEDTFSLEKTRDKLRELIPNHILDWKGIDEAYNPENLMLFLEAFGSKILLKEDELTEESSHLEEVDLSEWIAKICKDPENFYTDDSENLVSTSQV